MTQAIIDPSEVKKFASDLKNFVNKLEQSLKRTESKLSNLGQTWRDVEHKKFEQQFRQSVRTLKPLMGDINEYIGFLGRKASAAEEYLTRR